MGDGHETESAVERLPRKWRKEVEILRKRGQPEQLVRAAEIEYCANDLIAALEEDGVIPTRK